MKKISGIVAILLLAWSCTLFADEVQVLGGVDRNRVAIDEEISYTVRISGARGNPQAPRLPSYAGFESFYTGRTSHFTFVGGKSTSTVEFTYVLVPKVAGKFTLQPVEVWIEGKVFKTLPLEIEVIGPTPGRPAPMGTAPTPIRTVQPQPSISQAPLVAAPQYVADDNIFIKAVSDKQVVYPNEQILLTYTLYTRYDTRYEGFEEEPSVIGFWIEDFPLDRDLGKETVTVGGKRYIKADVRKIALFPTAAADYTIQPGVLKASIREEPRTTSVFDDFFADSFFSGSGFFGRRVERLLKPDPIKITVRPLPDRGKPESFNGAVGQFRLSASVDKTEVKQNEPVTLTFVMEGEGNIETLPRPPIPKLTAFKIYDGDSSSQLFKVGSTIGGKKTLEVIFIPTEAGALAIPPLEFSFFEPRRGTYQVLRTPSFPLKVIPSTEPARLPVELEERAAFKKEVEREAQDIHYIQEEIPSARSARILDYLFQGLVGVNLLGLLLVGNGLLKRRRDTRLARDTALRRRTLARTVAERRLKPLKRLAASRDLAQAEQFLGEAEKVLSEYFCNKFNVSPYSFTREWLEEKLAEICGAEDPFLKQAREFYDHTEEARFGRGALSPQARQELLDWIHSIIHRIEKWTG